MYHTQFRFSVTAEEAIGAVDREGTCRTRSRKWKEDLRLRERHTTASRKASWPAHGAGHGRAPHGHATPARRGSWAAVGHGAGPAGQRGPAVARTCPALAPVCSAVRAALAPLSSRSVAGPPLSAKAHQLNTTKSLAHIVKDRYCGTGIRSGLRYFQVQSRHFCSDHSFCRTLLLATTACRLLHMLVQVACLWGSAMRTLCSSLDALSPVQGLRYRHVSRAAHRPEPSRRSFRSWLRSPTILAGLANDTRILPSLGCSSSSSRAR